MTRALSTYSPVVRVQVQLPPGLSHIIERLAAERGRGVPEFVVELIHAGVEAVFDPSRDGSRPVSHVDGPFVAVSDREALCRAMFERFERDPDGAPPPPPGCPPPRGR